MQKFREWLIGTYNGLYKIILEPSMPTRQTVFLLVLVFIIGLISAYLFAPIVFYDADPSQLDQSWQNEWVRLLADRYAAVSSSATTGPDFEASIVQLLAAIDNPVGVVDSLGITDNGFRQLAEQAQPGRAAPQQPSLIGNLLPFIIGAIVIAILTAVVSLLWKILIYPNLFEPALRRRRGQAGASDQATQRTIDAMRAARAAEDRAKEGPSTVDAELGEPVTRKMSVYLMGRGQYDDSFEIENSDEMFLGECGAAIAETVGDGSPEKVSAIEVWLFDKDDFVRTLTGVFATSHAANDPGIRSKLEPKGEMVVFQPGASITLETNSLRLRATVIEMTYGAGDSVPPNSFLESTTIEIAVWQKAPGAVAIPAAAPAASLPLDIDFDPPPVPPSQVTTPSPATFAPPAQPRTGPPSFSPPSPPSQRPPPDEDPFGGTGDFTPIG